MSLNQTLIAELKHEMPYSRTTLERIPFIEKRTWKPHDKSMEIGKLAKHLADIPSWITMTLVTDELDFAKEMPAPKVLNSNEDLLQLFDENLLKAMELLSKATDEQLMGNWTMRNGDKIFFTLPRIAVIRSWVMNHNIHHRAQLGVYLRLLDIAVPSIYGPSADEGNM